LELEPRVRPKARGRVRDAEHQARPTPAQDENGTGLLEAGEIEREAASRSLDEASRQGRRDGTPHGKQPCVCRRQGPAQHARGVAPQGRPDGQQRHGHQQAGRPRERAGQRHVNTAFMAPVSIVVMPPVCVSLLTLP
jgi:hypothetical protein